MVKMAKNPDARQELKRLRRENAFHKRMNEDMLCGLRDIYKEIAQLTEQSPSPDKNSGQITVFHEAARQLDEVLGTTLRAADDIMNKAEDIQANGAKTRRALAALREIAPARTAADEITHALEQNLANVNAIVEALSFQDLTGQRIKRVVSALGHIRDIVVQTYVAAGLMIKKCEEEPEKDLEAIAEESRKQAKETAAHGSGLHGPDAGASQQAVDDLLAKLGI